MAGASLFTLLDDIATLLDDIAAISKVAIQKTTGVLGDDLALNAKQVTGISAERELPVVFRVGIGSAVNKLILIPGALAINACIPWAIIPLLMIGGIYLCYEGVEKLVHTWLHPEVDETDERVQAVLDPDVDLVKFERDRIQGAIRTDFILSAEIIVITLGILKGQTFLVALGVMAAVGVVMTLGVYGFVALIVKLDDIGLHLLKRAGVTTYDAVLRSIGRVILWFAPYLLRFLSVAGTVAMFLVGGGIITHNLDWFHHPSEAVQAHAALVPVVGGILKYISPMLFDTIVGVLSGAAVLAVIDGTKRLFTKSSHA